MRRKGDVPMTVHPDQTPGPAPAEEIVRLGDGLALIDVYDLELPRRTGAYVFPEDRIILETGPAMGAERLLSGLRALGVEPASIETIIVTHIHLDHAGAVGLLLREMPHARVVVHPRGARHLVDPTRLIAGARAVYGERYDRWFDPVLPVPEDRLIVPEDGERRTFGRRTFLFLDTPGHARHHLGIVDLDAGGLFAGDTLGVLYADLLADGVFFVVPSTSPNQFDPEATLESARRLEALRPKTIYYGHFGATDRVEEAFYALKERLPGMLKTVRDALETAPSFSAAPPAGPDRALAERARDALLLAFRQELERLGVPADHPAYAMLGFDATIDALGILDHLGRTGR
ncbi:MAG: Beta-lactamase related protein [Hydrogenibacillus schlegelii]|uniref:Beta-lactamase related protein n=2 Tax=Hydrogenibacillus schlegelii TaxID=1484 RepID=A0A2T5GB81_HYDSH|nr:MAG: Beta-lactamase related protein [Hydrogenibacillus schlegelii]